MLCNKSVVAVSFGLALVLILFARAVCSADAGGQMKLTAGLEQSQCVEGQAVTLDMEVRNIGSQSYLVGMSAFDPSAFEIHVTDGRHREVPRTTLGDAILTPPTAVTANVTVVLRPGESETYRFNLAHMFDLSRSGYYWVSLSRTMRIEAVPSDIWNLSSRVGALSYLESKVSAGPLQFRMSDDAGAVSGSTVGATPSSRGTFLYIAGYGSNGDNARIYPYRVLADGSVSEVYDGQWPGGWPLAGKRVDSVVATPDGRFLYATNCDSNDFSISQFKIEDGGELSPLSPATVHDQIGETDLLVDPQGRYLYGNDTFDLFAIGSDGRLTVAPLMPSAILSAMPRTMRLTAGSGAITADGRLLLVSNGSTTSYKIAPNGQISALPRSSNVMSETEDRYDNSVVAAPSGAFAYVLTSTRSESGNGDAIVAVKIGPDGSLSRIGDLTKILGPDGKSSTCQTTSLAVDPTGRFLLAANPDFLASYRIGADGSLSESGAPSVVRELKAIAIEPSTGIIYALCQSSDAWYAFRLSASGALTPANVALPPDVPFAYSFALASAATPQEWRKSASGLSISAYLTQDVYEADSSVILNVDLRNDTNRPLRLGSASADMSMFRLSVLGPGLWMAFYPGPAGQQQMYSRPLLAAGNDLLHGRYAKSSALVLAPGEEQHYRFDLSRLVDLAAAGSYSVQISRVLPNGFTADSVVTPFRIDGSDIAFTTRNNHWGITVQ